MSITNSLLVALIVMTIVFGVLAILSLILKLQTSILSSFSRDKSRHADNIETNDTIASKSIEVQEISEGELKLIDVDERTAAMIMALTSDELKVPLNELQFKSIRALD
jgi:hypothetical protein